MAFASMHPVIHQLVNRTQTKNLFWAWAGGGTLIKELVSILLNTLDSGSRIGVLDKLLRNDLNANKQ